MQSSENDRAMKMNRRQVQTSTTLNRRYTKRPTKSADVMVSVKRSPKVSRYNNDNDSAIRNAQPVVDKDPARPASLHPIQTVANEKLRARALAQSAMQVSKVSAQELKEQAIQKALASAEKINEKAPMDSESKKSKVKTKNVGEQIHFGLGRVLLALSCAAAAVFAIVYFVNLNMPDISLRVAAMQTGMNPTYPNYVPRDYSVSSITSEDGKITMEFVNSSAETKFTLIEEKSSWDTNALVSNFIKEEYGENYSIVREQGLTIYISNSDAAWVNGGIVYKIKAASGVLTNKQIRSIATSLQ